MLGLLARRICWSLGMLLMQWNTCRDPDDCQILIATDALTLSLPGACGREVRGVKLIIISDFVLISSSG